MSTVFNKTQNYSLFFLKKNGGTYLIDRIDIVADGEVLK